MYGLYFLDCPWCSWWIFRVRVLKRHIIDHTSYTQLFHKVYQNPTLSWPVAVDAVLIVRYLVSWYTRYRQHDLERKYILYFGSSSTGRMDEIIDHDLWLTASLSWPDVRFFLWFHCVSASLHMLYRICTQCNRCSSVVNDAEIFTLFLPYMHALYSLQGFEWGGVRKQRKLSFTKTSWSLRAFEMALSECPL